MVGDRLGEPKLAAALFYGFSRQCSRRPFLLAKGPPIWAIHAYTGPHCLRVAWSLRRSPRPHRPGRYFIPALKRAPAEISFRNSLRSRARCRGPVATVPEEYRGSERRKTLRRRPAVLALCFFFFFFFFSLNSRVLLHETKPKRVLQDSVNKHLRASRLEFLPLC